MPSGALQTPVHAFKEHRSSKSTPEEPKSVFKYLDSFHNLEEMEIDEESSVISDLCVRADSIHLALN